MGISRLTMEKRRRFDYIVEAVTRRVLEDLSTGNDYYDVEDDIDDADGECRPNPWDEYEAGYPNNPDYTPDGITAEELLNYCENSGDFLYMAPSATFGVRVRAANTDEEKQAIRNALYDCSYVEPTHELDWAIWDRRDLFDVHTLVTVYKIVPPDAGGPDLYIIYEQDR